MDDVVLVVGPEVVRRLTTQAIEGGNYRTVEAESAEEALYVLESQRGVSLVVSSVRGIDLANGCFESVIKRRWPHIAVMIASPGAHYDGGQRSFDCAGNQTMH